ncbi:MAG: hypothetical protein Aurels2KO_22340 [Aureliella sp.]
MSTTPTAIAPVESEQKRPQVIAQPTVVFRPPPPWKRAVDVVGSVFLLVVLLPVWAAIALYIRIVSRGPVVFCQERIGAGAQPFVIKKFRTMAVADTTRQHREYIASLTTSDKPTTKPTDDRVFIPGGKLLRSLSLDELPQLLNVLAGDMSLVGPRPEVLLIEDYEPWQLRRFEVLPGISGLWQVSGKNSLTFKQMIELDIRYVDSLSPILDLKIILKTFRVVFSRENR